MKDFYQELSEYEHMSTWMCEQRSLFAPIELAWQWHLWGKEDPLKFYSETDLYKFDLSMYHTSLLKRGMHAWFEEMLRKYDIKTMLDFGGGIGEYSILAEQNGVTSIYTDVGKTADYAKWRFEKYNVKPLDKDYGTAVDLVMAMVVFEHFSNPEEKIKELAGRCTYIIANQEEIPYNQVYPQHISKFDLSPYFRKVERYLWKKK